MSDLTTPRVPISKIDVEKGFNARTHMDEKELDGLAASLGSAGVVQPLSVRMGKGDRFILVAGHRRFAAAQRAGLTEVPVALSEGNAHLSSLVENLHREELDPIDTALGLRTVAGELNLGTNKAIAEKVGKSVPWVSDRLRLLSLPKGVQRYIAEGLIPIEAERLLRDIATISPRVAECVCELAKRNGYKGRYFLDHFADIFAATAEAKFNDKPTMISARAVPVSAIAKGKKRRELVERVHAISPHYRPDDPAIRFEEAEVDAARAAGCLVEHRTERHGMVSSKAFITDVAIAADLFERAIERAETEAKKQAEEEEAWKARRKEIGGSEKDDGKALREEAKEKKAIAEVHNEDLAGKLLKARTAAHRKQHGLARAKAIALLVIGDNPELAGRGLRLTLPGLQDVEVKELKSGKKSTKVTYADAEQCKAELIRRVNAASTEAQVNEVMAEAIVAAILVDEDQLPQSKRIRWFLGDGKVEKLLASDIKAARPRRRTRKEGN
jgi:ParB/RepB/Spo0J family partition protein